MKRTLLDRKGRQVVAAKHRTLTVHIHDGIVWEAVDRELPFSSGLSLSDYLRRGWWDHRIVVRTHGSRSMSEAILGLYYRKDAGDIQAVQLCSPLSVISQGDWSDPSVVLYHMRNWYWAPSQGGYHEADDLDFLSYYLALHVSLQDTHLPRHVVDVLHEHPMYKALKFFSIAELHTAKVIAEIRDPRWYVRPLNPDSSSKLMTYLGLIPRVQREVCRGIIRSSAHQRCNLLLEMWQSRPKMRRDAILSAFYKHRQLASGVVDEAMGSLRASQKLASYIRFVWLDAIYRDRAPYELFCPDMFFPTESEATRYREFSRH